MKCVLSVILLALSLSAFAESPCPNGQDTCWRWGAFSITRIANIVTNPRKAARDDEGIYFARGIGATCEQATQAARLRMMDRFDYLACEGQVRCGRNGVPFLRNGACGLDSNGRKVAWLECDNVMSRDRITPPRNNSAVGIILIESARRNEVRARASRQ